MKIKDIIGNLGILPRLAVKEYDRQQDKVREGEDALAQLAAMKSAESATPTAGMKKGGKVKGYSIDGIAKRGKTRAKHK